MIVRITGTISEVRDDRVIIDLNGLAYEVLVCGYAVQELEGMVGRHATLETLHYLEGSAAGGNFVPRLIGFPTAEDRRFFERFITVKNIGARKALKALAMPVPTVAAAIESGDAMRLSALPGIGRRAADQIIAELRGKMADFALGAAAHPVSQGATDHWSPALHDALAVIVALGERRADAQRWLERAIQSHPGEDLGPDEWVRLAYRVRSASED